MISVQSERATLARIGFFLCREGLIAEAEGIFAGLAESEPDRDGPAAGLALCAIIRGDSNHAVDLLDRHLAKGESCAIPAELSLYKLLALGMGGRLADARALRDDMMRKGMEAAVRTADLLLDDLSSKAVR